MANRVGRRLTEPQRRVLEVVVAGSYKFATIASHAGMSMATCHHTLDALTRRNLVVPYDDGYKAKPQAARVLDAQ